MKIKAADGIVGVDDIARDKDLTGTVVKGDPSHGVPRNVEDLPFHSAEVQGFASLKLSICGKGKVARFKAVLHLTHLLEDVHAVDGPLISFLHRIGLQRMDP